MLEMDFPTRLTALTSIKIPHKLDVSKAEQYVSRPCFLYLTEV